MLLSGCGLLPVEPREPEEPIVQTRIIQVPTPVRPRLEPEALQAEYVPPLPDGRVTLTNRDLAVWIEEASQALQLMQGRLEALQELFHGDEEGREDPR